MPLFLMRFAGAVLTLLACQPAEAQVVAAAPQHLECFADVYPPYTRERDGVVSGIAVDLLKEAGRRV